MQPVVRPRGGVVGPEPTEAEEEAELLASLERIKTAKERVSIARYRLIDDCAFFGSLLMKAGMEVVDGNHRVGTLAVTPAGRIYVNATFVATLSEAELKGGLCHEILHVALLCFARQEWRVAMGVTSTGHRVSIWNLAHDYVVNLIIHDFQISTGRLTLPQDALLDERFRGMAAEEVYDILVKEIADNGTIEWPGIEGGGLGPDMEPDLEGEPGMTPEEDQDNTEKWKVAVLEAAMQHQERRGGQGQGCLPEAIQTLLDDVRNPKVRWEVVLARFVGENGQRSEPSYRRPSRRSEGAGVYLPSMVKHGIDDIAVLWDTSGSMWAADVQNRVLSETIGICETWDMRLRVICVDYGIQSDQHDVDTAEQIEIKGGGGSNFVPAFDRLVEEGYSGSVVAFTDGYIEVPDHKPPGIQGVLWVIGPGDVDPTGGEWGHVLEVDKDGYVVKGGS